MQSSIMMRAASKGSCSRGRTALPLVPLSPAAPSPCNPHQNQHQLAAISQSLRQRYISMHSLCMWRYPLSDKLQAVLQTLYDSTAAPLIQYNITREVIVI